MNDNTFKEFANCAINAEVSFSEFIKALKRDEMFRNLLAYLIEVKNFTMVEANEFINSIKNLEPKIQKNVEKPENLYILDDLNSLLESLESDVDWFSNRKSKRHKEKYYDTKYKRPKKGEKYYGR